MQKFHTSFWNLLLICLLVIWGKSSATEPRMLTIFFALFGFVFHVCATEIIISDDTILSYYDELEETTKTLLKMSAFGPDTVANNEIIESLKNITKNNFLYLKKNNELKDIGFRNRVFFGADFSSLPLIQINLSNAIIVGCSFENMRLNGVIFGNTILNRSNFINAKLVDADFRGASAQHALFWEADLGRANFSKADLRHASFNASQLGYANFTKAIISNANFDQASMKHSFVEFSLSKIVVIERALSLEWLRKHGANLPRSERLRPAF